MIVIKEFDEKVEKIMSRLTEPKIKFYYGIKGSSYDEAQKESAAFGEKVMELIYDILEK